MNKEDITRLAQEAGFVGMDGDHGALRRFAALVASAERERLTDAAMKAAEKSVDVAIALEREACAKVCDDHCGWTPRMIGETIRARGQA